MRDLGAGARKVFGLDKSMGSWTGLPPMLGAPVSGALWGAGAGLTATAAGKVRDWILDREEKKTRWARNALIGASAGVGLGVLSGKWQGDRAEGIDKEHSWNDMGDMGDTQLLVDTVMRDQSLAFAERSRLARLVRASPPHVLHRLKQSVALAGGAGAGLLIARMLGFPILGQTAGAALGGFLAKQWFAPKPVFI